MVTSLEELKKINDTKEVELPPFADGSPFVARIRNASVINMVHDGAVYNPLLETVLGVINGKEKTNNKAKKEDEKKQKYDSKETIDFIVQIVNECLVEPSMQDINDSGIKLTDSQLIAIFKAAMDGVEDLQKFC